MNKANIWISLFRSYNDVAPEDICYKMWDDRIEVLDNPIHEMEDEQGEVVWSYFSHMSIEAQWHIAILYKLMFGVLKFMRDNPTLVLGRSEDGLSEFYQAIPYIYDALFCKEPHAEFVSYEKFDWDEFLDRPDSSTFKDLSYITIDVSSRMPEIEDVLCILSYQYICIRRATRTYETLEQLHDLSTHTLRHIKFEQMKDIDEYAAQILSEIKWYRSIRKTVLFLSEV